MRDNIPDVLYYASIEIASLHQKEKFVAHLMSFNDIDWRPIPKTDIICYNFLKDAELWFIKSNIPEKLSPIFDL